MITKVYNKSKKVCKTTFSLPKAAVATAKNVALLGEFNNWNQNEPVVMKKAKDGSFEATLELPIGRKYEFRYLIDNAVWENDWAADDYTFISQFNIDNSVVAADEVVIVDEVLDVLVKKTAKVKAKAKPAKAKAKPTVAKAKPVVAKADDLKKIEGIGPKIASLLNEAGIITFADLAAAKQTALKAVLTAAGPRFKMHKPTTWAKQAKLAAKGEWTKLKKLQDELNGGVAK